MTFRRLTITAALLTGSALPALAQDGLCGGVGANGQWLGGEEAMSDIATSETYLEQMALVLQNTEYVGNFSVSTYSEVRIEAEGRGSGDTVIDVRDAAGNIVASDDDSGGNSASRIETGLEPGSYCISMRSYDGQPMTGFVRVGLYDDEPLTDGLAAIEDPIVDPFAVGACDTAMMTDIGGGSPIDDMLSTGGVTVSGSVTSNPFWGFTLAAPQMVTITAENENADPYITVYDPFGNYLTENDDYNGLNSQIDFTYPLDAGTYCMSMSALTDTTLPITVAVTAYDPAAAMLGMYDRAEASPPMDGSYPITALGTLSSRLRADIQTTGTATWYSLDMPEGGLLVVEAITNGLGDPVLVLFDDFGSQVAYNDDNGTDLDSRITARLLPGTYMVAVKQLSEGGPNILTRMLFERWVPAQ